jgi:hypothetical protein
MDVRSTIEFPTTPPTQTTENIVKKEADLEMDMFHKFIVGIAMALCRSAHTDMTHVSNTTW